jgi:hypothetical protein
MGEAYRVRCLVLSVAVLMASSGCGVSGGPVAPESIGVKAKLERERIEQERRQSGAEERERIREEPAVLAAPEGSGEEPPVFLDLTQPGARPQGDVFVRPR